MFGDLEGILDFPIMKLLQKRDFFRECICHCGIASLRNLAASLRNLAASLRNLAASLRNLAASLKRNINFDALLTPELGKQLEKNPVKGVQTLAAGLQLEPEVHSSVDELAEPTSTPLLVFMNGNWTCALNLKQNRGEAVTLYELLVKGKMPVAQRHDSSI